MYDISVVLDSRLFESYITNEEDPILVQAAKVTFVLLHELDHKKNIYIFLLMQLIVKLHQKLKKFVKWDGSGQVTTGHLLEKYCFGGKVDLGSISPRLAKELFGQSEKENNWKNFVEQLKTEVPPCDTAIAKSLCKRTYHPRKFIRSLIWSSSLTTILNKTAALEGKGLIKDSSKYHNFSITLSACESRIHPF